LAAAAIFAMALAVTAARAFTTAQYIAARKLCLCLWQAQISWLRFHHSSSQADTFVSHHCRQRTFFSKRIFGTKIFRKKDHIMCIVSSYLRSQYFYLWILGYLYPKSKMKSKCIIFQSKSYFPSICISRGSVTIFDISIWQIFGFKIPIPGFICS
jgi:hypothetical protein